MKIQATQSQSVNNAQRGLKVRIGYKKYIGYSKIYCLNSQSLLGVQMLGKDRIRFTIPQYKYSEVMLLGLETELYNVNKGGRVL
ncbi:MAG TPA: hypothetical protein VH500_05795 [Nitrososphaeraceae archaeon]|jgi:hypothetical protein